MSTSDKDIEYTLVLDGHFISSEMKEADINAGGKVINRRAAEPAGQGTDQAVRRVPSPQAGQVRPSAPQAQRPAGQSAAQPQRPAGQSAAQPQRTAGQAQAAERVQIPETRGAVQAGQAQAAQARAAQAAQAEAARAAQAQAARAAQQAAQNQAPQQAEPQPKAEDPKEMMDRLYYEYEKMCYSLPTVLDMDDAYPHSYHWRLGDRYDQGKMPVLKEAVKRGVKIESTEAYQEYVESVKNRKFKPVSWD